MVFVLKSILSNSSGLPASSRRPEDVEMPIKLSFKLLQIKTYEEQRKPTQIFTKYRIMALAPRP